MKKMNQESKDNKINLRISEEDLEIIDEFIEENPQVGTRSEFLRNCALSYIKEKQSGLKGRDDGGITVYLPAKLKNYLKKLGNSGFYRDVSDVILDIIYMSFDNGTMSKILEKNLQKADSIKRFMRNLNDSDESEADFR
ncbi:ribbon-helix-helix domain-containing protein [Caldiplasma sukawensis]